MSWNKLKSALNEMRSASSDGFEGFVGQMLAALFSQPFIIARSGDQPGGDGRSYDGSVRFQTKHYTVAKIDDFEIVTDFHRVRSNFPSMEVYALGTASTIKEQLRSTLDALEIEFGISIIALDYATESSALTLLTIEFWEVARRFKPLEQLDTSTQDWIAALAKEATLKTQVANLRNALNQSNRLFAALRTAASQRLNERFGKAPDATAARFEIALDKSVPRSALEASVSAWRKATNNPVLVFEGEEGMGKSWAAAAFASQWILESNSAVLWLDSHEWAGIQGLHHLLEYAVERMPIKGVTDWSHWKRKTECLWSNRLTIVLDGANEGNALVTAQALVTEIRNGRRMMPRIVFTTRPLARLHQFSVPVWRSVSRCEVKPYDDAEFSAALKLLDKPIRRDEIPAPLEKWARIPRLLKTCSRLRDQFGGLNHVTREMILWAELLDKINHTDPQVRETLGWRNDEEAATVLVRLVQQLLASGSREILTQQMTGMFAGSFREVLIALEELRLADKAQQMRTTVNADCNLLGLALLIHERLRLTPASSVRAQSEEFQKFLEPLAEVDERTKALLVALQLTALSPPREAQNLSLQRSALLHAWGTSHNADVSMEHFLFWTSCDVTAYAGFTEALFEEILSDHAIDLVLSPLAHRWRDDAPTREALLPAIQKWLLLTWPDCEANLSHEVLRQGHLLPVARREPQLKLTLAAIRVVSSYPILEVLPSLAISRATLEDATSTWMIPKTPAPNSELIPHTRPLKQWAWNYGALMRFGFTEECMPELKRLAQLHQKDTATLKGLQLLTKSLGMAVTPPELELQPIGPKYVWKGVPARTLLRDHRRLFPGQPGDFHVQESDFSYLVIRDDLPDLLPEDREHIFRAVEAVLASNDFEAHGRSMTEEDYDWKRLHAWYAKYAPRQLLRGISEFRGKAFAWPEPLRALIVVEDFLHDATVITSSILLERAKAFALNKLDPQDHKTPFLAFRLHHLALLNFSVEELIDWLEFASGHESLRDEISHYPNTAFLRALIPPELAEHARVRVQEYADELSLSDDRANGRFDFWSRLAAISAEPSEPLFDWGVTQFQQLQPTGDRRFHWLCLLVAFAPDARLNAGLQDGTLRPLFDRDGCEAAWFMERQLRAEWLNGISSQILLKSLPIEEVGKILLMNQNEVGFAQWGRELLARANELVGNPPFERRYWGDFVLDFDKGGHVECLSVILADKSPDGTEASAFTPPRGSNFLELLRDDTEQRNEAHRIGNADYKSAERSSSAELFYFGGLPMLNVWRTRHGSDFLALAKPFINRAVQRPDHAYHFGSLIHALLCNLLVLEPDEAVLVYKKFMEGGYRVNCNTVHKVPQFEAALWNPTECGLARHRELRRSAVLHVRSEREVMNIAIAARANGGAAELEQIAHEHVALAEAKDRAIGISILAWLCTKQSLEVLDRLATTDPVIWLRHHADWAAEINRQNSAAARFYARILLEDDPGLVSTMFAQLTPALTPMARVWRLQVESDVLHDRKIERRIHGFAILSWESWASTDRQKIELAGRNLDEWRWGENLRQLDAPAPFPFCPRVTE
jgi:hypothetical protein